MTYVPHKMRRHNIIRILLILFIVTQVANIVLGAPVAAREKLKVYINADETEDGTAALKKRVNVEEVGQQGTDLRPVARHIPLPPPTPLFSPPLPLPPPPRPPIRLFLPVRPVRPFRLSITAPTNGPIPIVRPVHPYLPLTHPLPPISPPPPAKGPASSSAAENPSTTGHQPIPQQNSEPRLDVHPAVSLNPEPHPLSNPEPPPPNQEPQALPNPEPHSLPNPEHTPPNPGPHPSASGEAGEISDILKHVKVKRTFPALEQ